MFPACLDTSYTNSLTLIYSMQLIWWSSKRLPPSSNANTAESGWCPCPLRSSSSSLTTSSLQFSSSSPSSALLLQSLQALLVWSQLASVATTRWEDRPCAIPAPKELWSWRRKTRRNTRGIRRQFEKSSFLYCFMTLIICFEHYNVLSWQPWSMKLTYTLKIDSDG